MIHTYPIGLQTNDDGSYSLTIGGYIAATITPDEPVTGIDALRELLGVDSFGLPLRKAPGGAE